MAQYRLSLEVQQACLFVPLFLALAFSSSLHPSLPALQTDHQFQCQKNLNTAFAFETDVKFRHSPWRCVANTCIMLLSSSPSAWSVRIACESGTPIRKMLFSHVKVQKLQMTRICWPNVCNCMGTTYFIFCYIRAVEEVRASDGTNTTTASRGVFFSQSEDRTFCCKTFCCKSWWIFSCN